ncbi:MAG: phosphotransferase [Gemmatimonadetes bacterium]|nr:phosphotransferase [Gemmatimonadota bacterium]
MGRPLPAGTRTLDRETDFLPRYDQARYRGCIDRVESLVPLLGPAERRLVERALDTYVLSMDRLGALPRSVIHGQLFGHNILLRMHGPERRIMVLDWETAAVGPGLFDLVSLTAGEWTAGERRAMRVAYFEEYQRLSGERLAWGTFCRDLDRVALYHALEWIAWWGRHRDLSPHFARFKKELARILSRSTFAPRTGASPATGWSRRRSDR